MPARLPVAAASPHAQERPTFRCLVRSDFAPLQLSILSYISIRDRRRAAKAAAAEAAGSGGAAAVVSRGASAVAEAPAAAPAATGTSAAEEGKDGKGLEDEEAEDGGHHTLAGETEAQRVLRRHVFMHDAVRWAWGLTAQPLIGRLGARQVRARRTACARS